MNANELADELDWMTPEKLVEWCNSVQTMLRQQQAEIERLENALVYLCVKCRGDLNCEGNGSSKAIVNWVHDYAAEVLDGKANK